MASSEPSLVREVWPPLDPWQAMIVGAGASAAGLAFSFFSSPAVTVPLLGIGAVAAGLAVSLRPKSPLLVACAGGVAVLTTWGTPTSWDTLRMVFGVLAVIALFAAALLALPQAGAWIYEQLGSAGSSKEELRARGTLAGRAVSRVIVSLLVVVHFAGILSAILSVPPPGRDQSWVAQQVWTRLQPYLQFSYLVNAYRFYSPEPGPPSLLWYHIEYADGSTRWLKVPTRPEDAKDPLAQEFTRRLSIAESTNQFVPLNGIADNLKTNRIKAGTLLGIPFHPELPVDAQYGVPLEPCRELLREYARYVGEHVQSEKDPKSPAVAVKIYRVVHRMLDPNEMARSDMMPTDIWTYRPYYQGRFVPPKARPASAELPKENGWDLDDPNDPFLYWLIPIYREAQGAGPDPLNPMQVPNVEFMPKGIRYITRDCLDIHANLKRGQ